MSEMKSACPPNSAAFLKFIVVGGIGFLTEATVLSVLVSLFGVDPITARCVSFPTAVTVTWLLNRIFSFRSRNPRGRESARYFLVQTIGAAINLSVFLVFTMTFPVLYRHPVIPLAIGSIAALLFNFHFSNKFVFRPDESPIRRP